MSPKLRHPFQVNRHGSPITDIAIGRTISSGISFGRLLPRMVPEYEEREAARFGYYNWLQWQELAYQEKASVVAHYRLSRLIKMHENDAVGTEMDRAAKKAQHRRK